MLLNDGQTLGTCGFMNQTARPQAPATVGLAFRLSGESFGPVCPLAALITAISPFPVLLSDDTFEQLKIEPFSTPPELPDVMKPQDSGSTANEQAVQ